MRGLRIGYWLFACVGISWIGCEYDYLLIDASYDRSSDASYFDHRDDLNSTSLTDSGSGKQRLRSTADGSVVIGEAPDEIEISAPFYPSQDLLYPAHGDAYPKTQAEKEDRVDRGILTYDFLLKYCQEKYQRIIAGKETSLTPIQRQTDYNSIADCALTEFGVKPYFIPQLVKDVDHCVRKLGPAWRMIRDDDIKRWDAATMDAVYQMLVTPREGSYGDDDGYFYSPDLYIYGSDGSLHFTSLSPDLRGLIFDHPDREASGFPYDPRDHDEGLIFKQPDGSEIFIAASVRCLRVAGTFADGG